MLKTTINVTWRQESELRPRIAKHLSGRVRAPDATVFYLGRNINLVPPKTFPWYEIRKFEQSVGRNPFYSIVSDEHVSIRVPFRNAFRSSDRSRGQTALRL